MLNNEKFKDTIMTMDKAYKPENVEKRIYDFWEKQKLFTPKIEKGKKPFTIIMPPPNSNASLHCGHAMFVTVEDILARYYRMLGRPTLWLPGADHAGILTQVVFERKLKEKCKTRYDLGRKKFFSETMRFTLDNKKLMEGQLRALGASCDWTRNSFTLDEKFNKPIYTIFKKLYDQKLIYRAKRMINWCSRCETALSDLEVEHKEEKSKLWFIKYPLKAGNGFIKVATTRPETMLGDTAVAVNPKDKRYKHLIGKTAILPLMNREIPIIADKRIEIEFGTGAVKITPAHDPIDFEIGKQHKLEFIQVIGFDNKMTKQADKYAGLETKQARKKVLTDLKKLGLLEKEKDCVHSVGHCERCKTIIEPLISTQWFIKIKPLAKPAIKAVKQGKIKIIPKRFEKIYFNWMENIRDWCISRQLWWGHQFPVWYCLDCAKLSKQKIEKLYDEKGLVLPIVKKEIYNKLEPIISIQPLTECHKCKSKNLFRDPDTLDTWFSSGQWPFNTLGWIENSKDFQYFYPTSVMETGYEILFFWVARMIMLGIYATGKIPFKTVYLHGMIRDAFGKKMSKSKPETCINPLDSVREYGADALRIALIMGNAPGTDSSLSKDKIKGMRNFANKIWNASRFVLSNEPPLNHAELYAEQRRKISENQRLDQRKSAYPDDEWILKELQKVIKKTTKYIEKYRFDLAAYELYHFFWHVFCDKYLEMTKNRREQAQPVLLEVLKASLIMLHPFMPFITEEIYQKLPIKDKKHSIMLESWPKQTSN